MNYDEQDAEYIYCFSHLRAHTTGWCTASDMYDGNREYVVLAARNQKDADQECRDRNYKLYEDIMRDRRPENWV